ncbi:MAG: aspartate ammonia-lyase [Lachnospiraceae bacterium]|jgi:aspartate ammonia-lyase|nr:aspartate ammonia-lyase [Lachnospiraceae bacterium]MCI1398216.1 aspartate ammonia-lyase [Lachnospiraceae bacterium]MCI1424451.1 aspartate ammonia-lyase [Lachnospiraceae bacterium]MCI1453228.1 aspartate ammonia-lyase [Lachnospiraceae bacterium]
MSEAMRTETDFLGSISLPADCLYGIETARAIANFPVSGRRVHKELILAIVTVKKAAAMANADAGKLPKEKAAAITAACDMVLQSPERYQSAFPTDALQGGAGTSTNMNVNEVLCNLALLHLGHACGEYTYLHPLDDVNLGQSTNDVYPTALRICAIDLVRRLSSRCAALQESLQKKEQAFDAIPKLGRTELMDAVPITLGEEFGAYAQAIARDRWRIYKAEERLRQINLGGTAVGTGNNTTRQYGVLVTEYLRDLTGLGLARAEYPMDLTQNCDVFVEVSGLLKALAVSLIKISSDLRLMGSGPYGGLSELRLSPLQEGSTIMPGKVNPVIPEMATQAAIQVMANDEAVASCASLGNFELNAFLPLLADRLLDSLKILDAAVDLLTTRCIDPLEADIAGCRSHLSHALILATVLSPYIGYEKASELAKTCGNDREKYCRLVLEEGLMTKEALTRVLRAHHLEDLASQL